MTGRADATTATVLRREASALRARAAAPGVETMPVTGRPAVRGRTDPLAKAMTGPGVPGTTVRPAGPTTGLGVRGRTGRRAGPTTGPGAPAPAGRRVPARIAPAGMDRATALPATRARLAAALPGADRPGTVRKAAVRDAVRHP